MSPSISTNQTILVGGGISGMTAALEAAECGKQVILTERNTSQGRGETATSRSRFRRGTSIKSVRDKQEAGLDGHVIQPKKLQDIAGK